MPAGSTGHRNALAEPLSRCFIFEGLSGTLKFTRNKVLNLFCYEQVMGKIKKIKFKELPAHKKFLWLVADNVTSNDILFISEQDYGTDSDKHAELITYFKQTLDTSKLESWYPAEVWELNRWSSPSHTDTVGHSRRAFSCAGLMAYYFDGLGNPVEYLDVLLPLFESLVRLDLQDWQEHFLSFLSHGLTKTKCPEDKFSIQFTIYLSRLSETTDLSELRTGYNQLMIDEMSMLKHHWEHLWNETWDSALEPEIDRAAKIIDTYLTHPTAYIFTAKFTYLKAEQVNDVPLSEDLKSLARRIARLGKGDITWLDKCNIDELPPTSIIYL